MSNWWPKSAIAGAILAAHIAALGDIFWKESTEEPSSGAPSETMFATVEIIESQVVRDKVPAPDLQLVTPSLSLSALQEIQLDDSIEDELAAVVSPASAPRPARVQSADPVSFARRAHLQPGKSFTVVLRVKVMEDGLVSAVDIIRTSDNPAADAAAVDYALELHWVPGTKDQKPEVMAVSLPVTLAVPTDALRKHLCMSARDRCDGNRG